MKLDLTKKRRAIIAIAIAFVLLSLCVVLAACATTEQLPESESTDPSTIKNNAISTEIESAESIFGDEGSASNPGVAESVSGSEDSQPAAHTEFDGSSATVPAPSESNRTATQAVQSQQPQSQVAHVHSWSPITEPYEVIDRQAWVETIYKTIECTICSVCGEDITNGDSQGRSITAHGKTHALAGQGGGCHSSTKQVPNGTVTHDAVTHWESRTVGYRCSSCGEEKSA